MSFRIAAAITVVLGILFVSFTWNSNPRHTKLPFGTPDLSGVQKQLARLPPDERILVEGYVKRSNGDVLPKQFSDPDYPLTARTFAEAIELQRTWEAKKKVDDARMADLRAQREAKLAPLRAVVKASVVKAEVMTRNEYQARRDPRFYQKPYQVDKSLAFMTTIRIENLSDETIVGLHGSLEARDAEAYLPMDLCWIDIGSQRPIPSNGSIEIECGHDYRQASQQQKDFSAGPNGRFTVVWEPKDVQFANGKSLRSGL